jgi:hypothetical protein
MAKGKDDKKNYTPAQIMALKSSIGPRATEAFTAPGQKPSGLAPSRRDGKGLMPETKTRLTVMDQKPSIFSPSQVGRAISNATRGMQGASVIQPPRKMDVLGVALGAAAVAAPRTAYTAGRAAASKLTAKDFPARVANKVIQNPIGKVVDVTKGGITGQMSNVSRVSANVQKNPMNVLSGEKSKMISSFVKKGQTAQKVLGGGAAYSGGTSAGAANQANKRRK